MSRIDVLTRIVVLIVATAVPATAQIMTIDADAARAAFRIGFGGRGLDVEGSIDSPLLLGIFRLRGSVGEGRWVGLGELPPPAGASPRVLRAGASALVFIPKGPLAPGISTYFGLGVGAYAPLGVEMERQFGKRVIWGIEGTGDQWTIGAEVEADLPNTHDYRSAGYDLIPAVRIGIAFRRHF